MFKKNIVLILIITSILSLSSCGLDYRYSLDENKHNEIEVVMEDEDVYVIGNYSFDRTYMHSDEIILLRKIQGIVENKISEKESVMLLQIIKNYEKPA